MENKVCENCKHFCQHYLWIDGKFQKHSAGHCKNRRPGKTPNVSPCSQAACEKWQSNEEQKAEQLARIEIATSRLGKQILEFAYYLQTLK